MEPLVGSEDIHNWAVEAERVLLEIRSLFIEIQFQFPQDLKREIMLCTQTASDSNIIVRQKDENLIIGGHKTQVNQLEADLKQCITDFQVLVEEKKYPNHKIFCLHSFSKSKLKVEGVSEYTLAHETGKISVKGNRKGRQQFWCIVKDETESMQEKSCSIDEKLLRFLKTNKAAKRIQEIFGMSSPHIVSYLEQSPDFCKIFFLSNNLEKDVLKKIKKDFQKNFDMRTVVVTKKKLQGCNDSKWNEFVGKLECDILVSISVNSVEASITVAGEKIALTDICNKIENYLAELCSEEDTLLLNYHEWKVISSSSKRKIEAIQQDIKAATISLPTVGDVKGLQATIIIRGDPSAVEHSKSRLQALQSEVCHKEEKMSNIPSARQLVDGMQERIGFLETTNCASINISVIREDTSDSLQAAKPVASQPLRKCFAILPNGIRVTLYQGDFTHHDGFVDVIINFVPLQPVDSDVNLKKLAATVNGPLLIGEFKSKLQSVLIKQGLVVKADNVGTLKCGRLWHMLVESWQGDKNKESYFFRKFLGKVFSDAGNSKTILLTTICSKPLGYPGEVFGRNVINTLCSSKKNSPDLMVIIYVDNAADALQFESQLKDPANGCHMPMHDAPSPAASKVQDTASQTSIKQVSKRKSSQAAAKHSQYIVVEKGDMLVTKVSQENCNNVAAILNK